MRVAAEVVRVGSRLREVEGTRRRLLDGYEDVLADYTATEEAQGDADSDWARAELDRTLADLGIEAAELRDELALLRRRKLEESQPPPPASSEEVTPEATPVVGTGLQLYPVNGTVMPGSFERLGTLHALPQPMQEYAGT